MTCPAPQKTAPLFSTRIVSWQRSDQRHSTLPHRLSIGVLALLLAASVLQGRPVRASHGGIDARLYQGTCENLAEPVTDLEPLGFGHELLTPTAATPAGPFTPSGAAGAVTAVASAMLIETSLDQLLSEPHAIQLSITSQEGDIIPLSCGNIGGVAVDGDLVFGLSNVVTRRGAVPTTGIAWLHANDDGTTTVRLFAAQGLVDLNASATPTAS